MTIFCVVFDLQHPREEYTQLFNHLDEHQGAGITPNCRLLISHNSADVLMRYLENFIFPTDTLFVSEVATAWALNKNFEGAEWLRDLQALNPSQVVHAPEIMHNPPSA
ncbi:MAG: hypothetical protein JWM78_3756 [Verrucomicrobiaceae bacterium]|nr:hypothetical protein [Verrucomicrobiaceae bacterium]